MDMDLQTIGSALSITAAMFLTPVIMRLWRRRSPPSQVSAFDLFSPDELKRRNRWIYIIVYFLSFVGIISPVLLYANGISKHNPWPVGLGFGLAVILPFIFVSLITLSQGINRFREFWRYFEIQNKLSLSSIFIFSVPLGAIGFVSLYKLIF
jgi:hypothetical protein